jgi:hypothetical protein
MNVLRSNANLMRENLPITKQQSFWARGFFQVLLSTISRSRNDVQSKHYIEPQLLVINNLMEQNCDKILPLSQACTLPNIRACIEALEQMEQLGFESTNMREHCVKLLSRRRKLNNDTPTIESFTALKIFRFLCSFREGNSNAAKLLDELSEVSSSDFDELAAVNALVKPKL